MSDVQNPVEEVPAAVPATEAPATETPAVEAAQETPAVTEEAAAPAAEETTDAPAAEEAKEVTPATEGVLGYKAPGLVKGLRFTKRFLYFSDEAVEAKNLSAYKQNEKPAVANPTVAWASQTGKGLLFLAKRAEDKATPAGIFNLSDVSDITKDGSNEFHFKVNGQKHAFQAADAAERDSWVVALEAKAADAKAEKETIVASEGYKAELEKLTAKPTVAEPVKKADADEAAPAEESNAKSRSQSRKRISIFGSLRTPKKEEAEEKAEEPKPAEATVTTEVVAEAPTEVAEVAAPAETADKKEEEKKAEIKSKRTSIFGNFFQKVTSPSTEKSEKGAAAPAESSAVASTAPQLDNPVEEAEVPAVEPEPVAAPAEEAVTAAVEAPAAEVSPAAKDKRRTSFFGNFGKKKGDSDNEGTDAESKPKGNKLGGLFRKPSKVVKSENKEAEAQAEPVAQEAPIEESPEEAAAAPAEAPATEEAKPVDVISTSTPVQATA